MFDIQFRCLVRDRVPTQFPIAHFRFCVHQTTLMRQAFSLVCLQFIVLLCNGQSETGQILVGYQQYLHAATPERLTTLSPPAFVINMNTKNRNQLRARVVVVLQNIRDLSVSWTNPKSAAYHMDSMRQIIDTSLTACVNYLRKDSEWSLYQWETVRSLCDIALLLRDDLSRDQMMTCIQFLKDHRLRNTGAIKDATLSDELDIHIGALTNELNSISSARDRLVTALEIGKQIQKDLSFHHEDRLEVFTPGRSFLLDNLRVAWQLRNTSWKFPEVKIILLTDVITNAWYLMTRGQYTVPGPVGIYSSKENALRVTNLVPYIAMMRQLCPQRENALTSLELSLNNKKSPQGVYHWPYSDFTAVHDHNFSFFIKTSSDRTVPATPQYPENQQG